MAESQPLPNTRSMLAALGDSWASALIIDLPPGPDLLLKAIAIEFGLDVEGLDALNTRAVLNEFLITRAASQSAELRSRLEDLGARVIECPTIHIVPPKTWKPVDDAIRRLNSYQWLLFTSANAVEQFMDRMGERRPAIPIAVVGSATAAVDDEQRAGAARAGAGDEPVERAHRLGAPTSVQVQARLDRVGAGAQLAQQLQRYVRRAAHDLVAGLLDDERRRRRRRRGPFAARLRDRGLGRRHPRVASRDG